MNQLDELIMAYYKYIHFLEHEDGPEYDSPHEAGAAAPFSGIYHCETCGSRVTAAHALYRGRSAGWSNELNC